MCWEELVEDMSRLLGDNHTKANDDDVSGLQSSSHLTCVALEAPKSHTHSQPVRFLAHDVKKTRIGTHEVTVQDFHLL